MNDKNLNYEIETIGEQKGHSMIAPAMNDKNLNYEIETGIEKLGFIYDGVGYE